MAFPRHVPLPDRPDTSLFLWGARQTGKTTFLKAKYPHALRIDLLKHEESVMFHQAPSRLRQQARGIPSDRLIVIDEVQKVPALLDEVHYLIEEERRIFVLCGSSARKLKRGHANLLGGRALRYEMFGMTARELGRDFDLVRWVNVGPLPRIYDSPRAVALLRAYVADYLQEEVLQEGLVRSLPVYSGFLSSAALSDAEQVNLTNIARETGAAVTTVRDHFQILVDTLLGDFVPAYTARAKRRVVHAPKFYFRNVGVVNLLARRGHLEPGGALFGKAFENFMHHEIRACSHYTERHFDISYWRLSSGAEVDFVLGDAEIAIECKAKSRVHEGDLKGLREFRRDHQKVRSLVVASLESRARRTDDGIWILPCADVVTRLWEDDWVGRR